MPEAPPAIALQERPRRHPDVAWRNWDGEVVILTPAGHVPGATGAEADGAEHDLNEVASRIFELCDGERTVAQIAAALTAEFEVEPAVAESDAAVFVADLVQKRLLILAPDVQPRSPSP